MEFCLAFLNKSITWLNEEDGIIKEALITKVTSNFHRKYEENKNYFSGSNSIFPGNKSAFI
jgi:hypothetical protein